MRTGFGLACVVALVITFGLFRAPLLGRVGRLLTYEDPLRPADLAVLTADSGSAGELESADLYHDHIVPRVAVLVPAKTTSDTELARRGVHPERRAEILARLGIPGRALIAIPAGEGGTTQGLSALVAWCQTHCGPDSISRMVVIVSPHHSARVHRVLEREMDSKGPSIAIRMSRYSDFRPDTWWRSRTTARAGIVELEKLLLDYVEQPF